MTKEKKVRFNSDFAARFSMLIAEFHALEATELASPNPDRAWIARERHKLQSAQVQASLENPAYLDLEI